MGQKLSNIHCLVNEQHVENYLTKPTLKSLNQVLVGALG
jgi:hypothetical protein